MLQNWKIRTRLGLLLVIPGVVLTILGGSTMFNRLEAARAARDQANRVEALALASDLASGYSTLWSLQITVEAARETLSSSVLVNVNNMRPIVIGTIRERADQLATVRARLGATDPEGMAIDAALDEVYLGLEASGGDRAARYARMRDTLDDLVAITMQGLGGTVDSRATAVVALADLSQAQTTWTFAGLLGPYLPAAPGTDHDAFVTAGTLSDQAMESLHRVLPRDLRRQLDDALEGEAQRALLDEIHTGTAAWGSAELSPSGPPPVLLTTAQHRLAGIAEVADGVRQGLVTDTIRHADNVEHDLVIISAAIALFLTVCGASLLVVTRSLTTPLGRLVSAARRLAGGDLDRQPAAEQLDGRRDEIGVVWNAFNELSAMLHSVAEQTDALAFGRTAPRADIPGPIGRALSAGFEEVARARAELESSMGRLRDSEEIASAVVSSAADAIWTIGSDGLIRTVNTAACELLGCPPSEQVGVPFAWFLPTTTLQELTAQRRIASAEVTLQGQGGRRAHALISTSRVALSTGETLYVVIGHDIDERKKLEEQLERLAITDPLTGVLNRAGVTELLDRRCKAPLAFALLFIDLDRFKQVNDTFGHPVGDLVLRHMVQRLQGALRGHDVIGRLAGDEFIVVLEGREERELLPTAERLRELVSAPYSAAGCEPTIGASIGVAVHDGRPIDAAALLQQADLAMYTAKQHGRGQVKLFDTALADGASRRLDIERALRQGIARGELVAHFQPVVELHDPQRITSAELLVRWHRPGHGLVPPLEFIPVAEESGLIVEIGRWVLRAACETLADWAQHASQRQLHLAVNISAVHIARGCLVDDVVDALRATGAPGRQLVLELTESALIADLDTALEQLHELRRLGVRIAIDDFGTGYSSLTYLRRLPVDTVKIDRSFIDGIGDAANGSDDNDTAIVRMITGLAHMMELRTIAEGVERDDQLALLAALGCDAGQGYLFSRPIDRAGLEALLDQHATRPRTAA